MNMYAADLSLFDFANFSDDPIMNGYRISSNPSSIKYYEYDEEEEEEDYNNNNNNNIIINPTGPPPQHHRHDGTSPLPLGMDWSPPPRKLDGRDTVWPHYFHTGWSYCVTLPSWLLLPKSTASQPIVFYRVLVGIQSQEGVTTTRGILRRFSDFLNLLSQIKKDFPNKKLPPAPPKRILKTKSRTRLEERRCSLEDWMQKLLSDIDVSRSAPVAMFLELEAAARASFNEEPQQQFSDANSSLSGVTPSFIYHTSSDISVVASDPDEISEFGTPRHRVHQREDGSSFGSDKALTNTTRDKYPHVSGSEIYTLDGHVRRLSMDSVKSDLSSVRVDGIPNTDVDNSDLIFPRDNLVIFPSDERQKLNRVLNTLEQRAATARTDVEDLIARLNQEVAVRQFLTTKTNMLTWNSVKSSLGICHVKDLEVELETTTEECKQNMQQAVLNEREKFTQMQWDLEELRKQCFETDLKLKSEQDEKARLEVAKESILQENKMLLQDLDIARESLENFHKHHEESEMKAKADLKILVKEVKSLRSSQSELKQELSRVMKEKLELERALQKEKQKMEIANSANSKLLHECEILWNRLQECSVNFLVEEEDKLIVDTSSPSDAIDLLTTSDNRIGLLLAEAQLLAQDIENSVARLEGPRNENDNEQRVDDNMRKMLTDTFVDNARLRMQVNSVIRCALSTYVKSGRDDDDEEEEDTHFGKTVLSKFL
ncbi:hypothetical protein ACFE04_031694 [Oxalis oulophora]